MDELVALATPDLYRTNSFRILNLNVYATPKDAQKVVDRFEMERKLGLPSSRPSGGHLALSPTPTREQDVAALERLKSPRQRLLDDFFWFWPIQGNGDPGLAALAAGNVDDAVKQWMVEFEATDQRVAAKHNLAVLFHLLALDDEARLAAGTADRQQAARLQTTWQRAAGYWQDVHGDDAVWQTVRDKAAALNDGKVEAGIADSIRKVLPEALLRINARLAFKAAERTDSVAAQRHIRLLEAVNFPPAARTEAIRATLQPWQDQVKQVVETARANWTRTPHQAARIVRAMHAEATARLRTIDVVLGKGKGGNAAYGGLRDGLHDLVGEAMLDGQMAYTRKTDDWAEGIKLLELANQTAAGEVLRNRLDENITILKDNESTGNDWCAPGYWDMPEATIAVFEAARERTRAGDFDGALASLLPLDKSLGRPLRRAAAYCLSVSGIRIMNAAVTEFNEEPPTRKRLLARVIDNPSLIMSQPNPSPHVPNPPCPLCGSTHYTRWSTFEMRGVPMWLCAICSDKVKTEFEAQRAVLRRETTTALERIVLADELDPNEPGVVRNLKLIKKQAGEINCPVPGTAALRARLDPAGQKQTRKPFTFDPEKEDGICFFCRRAAPDAGAGIAVPMCNQGDVVERLLSSATAILVATVTVPRCQRCRDAHWYTAAWHRKWRNDLAKAERSAGGPSGIGPMLAANKLLVGAAVAALGGGLGAVIAGLFDVAEGPGGWLVPGVIAVLAGGPTTWLLSRADQRFGAAAAARRKKARVRFIAKTPEPLMPPGVKPQDAFEDFHRIRLLRRQKWSFGTEYVPARDLDKSSVQGLTPPK